MNTLLLSIEGPIARIVLNRPDRLNAISGELILELHQALSQVAQDTAIKIVHVSGAGRAFSAGVDLKETTAEGFRGENDFLSTGLQVAELLRSMNKVTIAQVHGYCFTGALELMLFFDLCFCAESTQFGDTHAKWAVMPRWGMSQNLARRVGLIKAKELTFRAMRVKGPEAERIGLVNRAFPDADLAQEVDQLMAEMLENSFEAIAAIKDLYDRGFETTLKEGLAIEQAANPVLPGTEEQLGKFGK
ncbi:MAG: enoyl-CoA hydratase/isomerase family protein [Bacteroidota bacterium]